MKAPDDPVPSGDQRLAWLFAEAFRRGGASVETLACLHTYDRGDPERQARLQSLGHRMALRLVERWRSGREAPPDAWFTYHLYHKAPDHLGPTVAEALAIPYIVAEASFAPKQAGGPFDIGHRAAARAIASADRIHCLNRADVACLLPLVAHPAVLAPIAPFLETADFRRNAREQQQARAALDVEFGFDKARPLILTVAMMRNDQKLSSYRVLADAYALLSPRPIQALIVGDGPARAKVEAAMAPLGARVVFAGRREGVCLADAYAGADLFVWPSVKEAFGMAFLEAAASGTAVVAGRSGGIDAIVEDGVTGLVVEAGDAIGLSGAIATLLDDPSRLAQMGRQAAARAQRVNDTAIASRRLIEDTAELIARRRAGTRT